MSQTVADLLGHIRRAAPADRQAALSELLAEQVASRHGEPVHVPGLGVFVPLPPCRGTPPVTTAAEDAELARRLATRHRSRPLSDFIRRLARPNRA